MGVEKTLLPYPSDASSRLIRYQAGSVGFIKYGNDSVTYRIGEMDNCIYQSTNGKYTDLYVNPTDGYMQSQLYNDGVRVHAHEYRPVTNTLVNSNGYVPSSKLVYDMNQTVADIGYNTDRLRSLYFHYTTGSGTSLSIPLIYEFDKGTILLISSLNTVPQIDYIHLTSLSSSERSAKVYNVWHSSSHAAISITVSISDVIDHNFNLNLSGLNVYGTYQFFCAGIRRQL